jgi:spermidine synthase
VTVGRRRGQPFFEDIGEGLERWSLRDLLLASFLTLFAELAFIRWIAVEIRVFAYFKNLALLLCFVGFGLGCALARKKVRWSAAVAAFMGLLLIVRIPFGDGVVLERLSQSLGSAADVEIWATGNTWQAVNFLTGVLLAGALFLLIVFVFVPLGQVVSRQMNLALRPLAAYSWNLLGSLAGILVFLGVSRLMLPPSFWLGAVLLGFAYLQASPKKRLLVASLLIPLALFLHDPSQPDAFALWTPYQQIQYTRRYAPNGDFATGMVRVNHTGYQHIVNLSPEFLARHPKLLKEALDENPYNMPFRFAIPSPSVMIVGSGTGNDVAAALRNKSQSVDAVEIDPAILELGKREHPERPYDLPRVSIHVTDARAFLKRTPRRYDLILFGLLDSHTQFSDYSNMRIDNFVYTQESFREASHHLTSNGVLFVKFQVDHPWMAARLAKMLQQTFGKPPVVFLADSSYSAAASCFVISPSNRVQDALAQDPRLAEFVAMHPRSVSGDVPVTTDDWPYLYQQGRWIPRTYYALAVLVILLGLGLYLEIGEARRQPPSLFFFSMGAGFLLLETQVISRLALFFGTTWQVNGIVISALLIALLLATAAVEKSPRPWPRAWVLAALLAGLALAYFLPFERLPGSPALVGSFVTAVFSVPVFFAGLLFATEFRTVESPSAALGANMLGAVVGGLLENLSLLFGMRALLLVTMLLYCLAGVGLRWRQRRIERASGTAA